MDNFKQIASINDVNEGQMKMFEMDGREILVARISGKYYAIDNRCPHMGGNLSKGTLQGTVITCPRHHSQIDITDGHIVRWTDWTGIKAGFGKMIRSPRPAKTYEVKKEGEKIIISESKIPVGAA